MYFFFKSVSGKRGLMMGENQDNFYVTLFSNSSMRACPNNPIAAFTVQLAHEIVLSGKDA
jgi:hypothetical protein